MANGPPPRIDKAPREKIPGRESDSEDLRPDAEYVEGVADFFNGYISEIRPAKSETGKGAS